MIILCDMDSILVDMLSVWLAKYNARTGEGVVTEEITHWKVDNFVKNPKLLNEILASDGFFRELSPMLGAKEHFSKLIADGHDVKILTQPSRKSPTCVWDKRMWMEQYFPGFPTHKMFFAHEKNFVEGDVFIDDNSEHLASWKLRHPKGITVTLDYAYNRDYTPDYRVRTWSELYATITLIDANRKAVETK